MKQVPRLVLHVGVHKTGTSTLQVALKSLRPQLRAHGVALITITQMKKLPHEKAWAARRTPNRLLAPRFQDELRELVDDEMVAVEKKSGEPAHTVLVTNERMVGARMPSEVDAPTFRPQAEAAIDEIIKAMAPGEVHVVLYTRRQDRLMESAYLWEIQKGESHTIRQQFPFIDDPVMSFFGLANRISGISGVGSLRVRPFELIAGGSLAYLDDFLVNIGLAGRLDYSRFEADPTANLSYSQEALEIALKMNPELETTSQRTALRRFLKQNFGTDSYPPAQILSDEERERLIVMYADDNERLFSTWMPDLPKDSYSSPEGTRSLGSVLTPPG